MLVQLPNKTPSTSSIRSSKVQSLRPRNRWTKNPKECNKLTSTLTPRSADYEVKLTQDHESFRHTIRDFAEKEIRPVAFEIDKKNKTPRELLDRIAKLGVPAITYKEE